MAKPSCPECGSNKVTKFGFVWRNRRKVQRYLCTDCGHNFIEQDRKGGKDG